MSTEVDIPTIIRHLEALASQMRAVYAQSGRRADNDAAYDFGEAAQHLRAGRRRLNEIAAEAAAREAALAPKKRSIFGHQR